MKKVFQFPANAELQMRRDRLIIFLFIICGLFAVYVVIGNIVNERESSAAMLISIVALVVFALLAWLIRTRFGLITEVRIHEETIEIIRGKNQHSQIEIRKIVALLYYPQGKKSYYAIQHLSPDLLVIENAGQLFDAISEQTGIVLTEVK
ncbi:MAG TPA: hypothetical protein PK610_13880 [Flavobacteriales bacterium]|nr:hypothetical protein [Flavobacteriales bacterium]